ncbi:MAG: hypothetical protein AB1627_11390 [Chloroflexota bacterium]|jgi:hypothetical protein
MADVKRPGTGLPPRRPAPPADERKHVIAEYRHRHQEVTCVCGWIGSSAMPDGRTSDWSRHVAASRMERG